MKQLLIVTIAAALYSSGFAQTPAAVGPLAVKKQAQVRLELAGRPSDRKPSFRFTVENTTSHELLIPPRMFVGWDVDGAVELTLYKDGKKLPPGGLGASTFEPSERSLPEYINHNWIKLAPEHLLGIRFSLDRPLTPGHYRIKAVYSVPLGWWKRADVASAHKNLNFLSGQIESNWVELDIR